MTNIYKVTVIDGSAPESVNSGHEPNLLTQPQDMAVLRELLRREPVFHRPEFGVDRADFERMTAPDFWEVGASGKRYSRAFVIDLLAQRYRKPETREWEIHDPCCMKIADDNYLMTYTLVQGQRVTRRSTIWRNVSGEWQVVFHQGTEVG